MNYSKDDFVGFSKDFKDNWVCPTCRCKEPKRGDNTNTPVRSSGSTAPTRATSTDTSSHYDNVTLRSKPRGAGSTNCSSNCNCISADSIREIIREELKRQFNTQITDIQSKVTTLGESLSYFSAEFDRIRLENESQKSVIEELRKDNVGLRTATQELADRVHQMEQLSRTNNIEIQCVPEHKSENLYSTVQQLAKVVKCPLTESDVQYCSRIAKFDNNSPRPRSILVKFSSRRLRDTYLAAVAKHNKSNPADKLNTSHLGIGGSKKTAVYVAEHLTPDIKALHAATRRKAKELNYKFVWVRDSKVFVRKTESSSYTLIKSKEALNSLS